MAVAARVPLANAPMEYDFATIQGVISAIEQRLVALESVASIGWQTSNVTASKTLDADAATLAELSDVVGTLIDELVAAGLLATSS